MGRNIKRFMGLSGRASAADTARGPWPLERESSSGSLRPSGSGLDREQCALPARFVVVHKRVEAAINQAVCRGTNPVRGSLENYTAPWASRTETEKERE